MPQTKRTRERRKLLGPLTQFYACARVASVCSTFVLLSAFFWSPSILAPILAKKLILPMKNAIGV